MEDLSCLFRCSIRFDLVVHVILEMLVSVLSVYVSSSRLTANNAEAGASPQALFSTSGSRYVW